MSLHIGIAGPIASADIAALLHEPTAALPFGYAGAPLLGTLIGELLRRGHRVSAFTLSSDLPLTNQPAVVASGPRFDIHFCPMRPRAWPFNGRRPGRILDLYAFERAGLEKAIATAAPDVVHAHWSYEFAWAALRSGVPHVITCHDSPFVIARYQRDFRHGAYRWLRAAMAWHVLRHARRVTTVSPYMVGQVQPLCRVPVSVVPNPIGDVAFAVPRTRADSTQRIVMVANGWDLRKNSRVALEAFALLGTRSALEAQTELRVFGEGHGEGGPAHSWWQHSGATGRVRFFGSVPHARLLDEFANADLLVHPALEESFGAVLAEAMAAGLPVVAGARSGAVPWVAKGAGLMVDVTRAGEVADAVRELLEDKEGARRFGNAARERVRDLFSAAAVATAFEHEYAAACNRDRHRPRALVCAAPERAP
jgi:L-malate glycosyltransferase